MMGIMVPEICWARNKICNKNSSVASSWHFISTTTVTTTTVFCCVSLLTHIAKWIGKVKFLAWIFLFATIFRLTLKPSRLFSLNETWFYEDIFTIGSFKVVTNSLELYIIVGKYKWKGCWQVLSPTRKETSYSNRRFCVSYILFINIIGGILVIYIYK